MSTRLIVTSPTGGAGRTTLALHLAVAFGASGCRTLLVDLDPNNGVAHALGRGDRTFRGVADVLALDVAPSRCSASAADCRRCWASSKGSTTAS
jgi:chromosome partitioning protein